MGYAKYRLSPLKKITDEARRIRAQHPKMKWKDAVKKAGAKYRGEAKTPKAKKRVAAKKVIHKKVAVKRKKSARKKTSTVKQGALFGRVGMAGNVIVLRNNLEKEIAWCETVLSHNFKNPKTAEEKRKKKATQSMLKIYKKQLRELNAQVYRTLGKPK